MSIEPEAASSASQDPHRRTEESREEKECKYRWSPYH